MEFNPSRLILARKRRGLSKAALSLASKISLRSLGYYESGEGNPSNETVNTLAEALQFPALFFFGNDIEEIVCDAASFRSLSTMTASQRDAALAAGSLALALDKWIGERFNLPAASVPEIRSLDPDTAADVLRAEWGLGEKPIKNIVHLVEANGIRVFSLPIDSASVDAFSLWHNQTPFIFLNSLKSGERSRMDIAHEVGHLTMHRHGIPRSRQAELEADRFASSFLMPVRDVVANIPRGMSVKSIHKLKARWLVSAMALVYRLYTLKILTEWQYRSYCIELSKAGFRKGEPGGIPRESSQIINKVFEALRSEGVTRNVIARDLAIFPDELNSLIAGLTLASVSNEGRNPTQPNNSAEKERPRFRLV